MNKCGDRNKNRHTIRGGYVNAICSNPHSDEITMILEYEIERDDEDERAQGGGHRHHG